MVININMLYYLASIVLTALIEIGIILIVNGDKYSNIHQILGDENRTIGLALILIAFGLVPVLNLMVAFILLVVWGMGEL